MGTRTSITVGLLILVLTSTAIYISLQNNVKIRVDDDKTTFYVKNENNRWVVSGREINALFDGTSKMYRRTSEITRNHLIEENNVTITRETPLIRGPKIIDTYDFDGEQSSVELFPISHQVEVLDGAGYFYRYEVRDLDYDGPAMSLNGTSMSFGKNMEVEWDPGYRWARVYKSGILKIQYDVPTDYEVYDVRLFDPTVDVYLDGSQSARKWEYNSFITISGTTSSGTVCLSLNAPGYGNDYVCGASPQSFVYNISTLRNYDFTKSGSTDWIRVDMENKTIMQNVSLNITSADVSGSLNVTYMNTTKKFRGFLRTKYLEDNNFTYSGDDTDAVNITFATAGSDSIFADLTFVDNPINLTFDLTGYDLDQNNQFNFLEAMNNTKPPYFINETIAYQTDEFGVFDDFLVNSTEWSVDPTTCKQDYKSDDGGVLEFNCVSGTMSNSNPINDLRNASRVEFIYTSAQGSIADMYIQAFDGTSTVNIHRHQNIASGGEPMGSHHNNISIERISDDGTLWNVKNNASIDGPTHVSSEGARDISSLDFTQPIQLIIVHGGQDGTNSRFLNMKWSGIWLNRSLNNGTFKSEGNVTSRTINVTEDNLQRATLTATDYVPSGTSIEYLLSNDCETFETVLSGISHTFESTGTKVCWGAKMTSNDNLTSPVIQRVQVDVVPSSLTNVTIEVDGVTQAELIGNLNSTTSPYHANLTPNAGQINTIKLITGTAGVLQVDNFKMNASMNPLVLDKDLFETCEQCFINFTFSGSNIDITNSSFDYLGSKTYRATAKSGADADAIDISIFYSDFNVSLPIGTEYFDVFAPSRFAQNVTPYSQSDSMGIFNLTNLAYDEAIDLYMRTNATVNECLNITTVNDPNRFAVGKNSVLLDETFQKITNTAVQWDDKEQTSTEMWTWVDLGNCSSRFELPWFEFAAICSDCVYSEGYLHNTFPIMR
tara:strand:- start:8225 stop:11056 length:2832 start_codon:yes stop_codon:yes gene_type:complete